MSIAECTPSGFILKQPGEDSSKNHNDFSLFIICQDPVRPLPGPGNDLSHPRDRP